MRKYAIITMDVEDWYHTYFPEADVDRNQSLLDGLDVALKIMRTKGIKGSFFVVGEIANQLSDKLREMDREGHNICCHNMQHLRPISMEKEEFKKQVLEAKEKLEVILGHAVNGYRAPSFGIDDERLEIVKECGFTFDSSKLKPQKSHKYGILNLPSFKEVFPCVYKDGDFTEFEVSTQKFCSMNMLLGGGYIRMLPWPFMKWMTNRYLKTGQPYVMYIHPIDLSPKPISKGNGISFDKYLRTHIGKKHMVKRFTDVIDMLQKQGYEFYTFEQLQQII